MSGIRAVFYREARVRVTNLTFIFWDLFYPLGYLLVFGVGVNYALGLPLPSAGVRYNDFFLAGVLGMASFGIASNTAWSFFLDRDNGIFYEMLTYPLSRAEFLLGKVLFNLFVAVAQAGITVGLGWLLLGIRVRADRMFLNEGVTFNVYGDSAGAERVCRLRYRQSSKSTLMKAKNLHRLSTPSMGKPCPDCRCLILRG